MRDITQTQILVLCTVPFLHTLVLLLGGIVAYHLKRVAVTNAAMTPPGKKDTHASWLRVVVIVLLFASGFWATVMVFGYGHPMDFLSWLNHR